MQTKVSFDYDHTLNVKEVEDFAMELIAEGIDVHICTYRYSDDKASDEMKEWVKLYYPNACRVMDIYGTERKTWNGDLYETAQRMGLSEENIHFTNYVDKDKFFNDNPEFLWHLDDAYVQIEAVRKTNVIPVKYPDIGWRSDCMYMINNTLGNYRV